jgi:WD40 repeat protein
LLGLLGSSVGTVTREPPTKGVVLSPWLDADWVRCGCSCRVWDLATGKCKSVLQGENTAAAVAISPDGATLVSAWSDHNVRYVCHHVHVGRQAVCIARLGCAVSAPCLAPFV